MVHLCIAEYRYKYTLLLVQVQVVLQVDTLKKVLEISLHYITSSYKEEDMNINALKYYVIYDIGHYTLVRNNILWEMSSWKGSY